MPDSAQHRRLNYHQLWKRLCQLSARRSGSGGTRSGHFLPTIEHGNSSPSCRQMGGHSQVLCGSWSPLEFYPPATLCQRRLFKLQPSQQYVVVSAMSSNPTWDLTHYKYFRLVGLAYRLRDPRLPVGCGISTPISRQRYAYNFPVRPITLFNLRSVMAGSSYQRDKSRLFERFPCVIQPRSQRIITNPTVGFATS